VDNNKLALSLGRLAAADPKAIEQLLGQADAPAEPQADTLDALVARAVEHLTAYQGKAYAQRYTSLVDAVRDREQALGADASLPLARTVARALHKLMAYKDEYEVARLYTDGEFRRALEAQFEGEVALEFYMAPPILSRARAGQAPRKLRLGSWMLPAMKLLAHGRLLRGTPLDPFGYTQERRMERELVEEYRLRIESLLPSLTAERLAIATEIAALPLAMRGFGHVKQANVAQARRREQELLHRFDPARFPRPPASREAGQIRGIRVAAAQ